MTLVPKWMVTIDVPYVFRDVEARTEEDAVAACVRKLPRNVRRRELCTDVHSMDAFNPPIVTTVVGTIGETVPRPPLKFE